MTGRRSRAAAAGLLVALVAVAAAAAVRHDPMVEPRSFSVEALPTAVADSLPVTTTSTTAPATAATTTSITAAPVIGPVAHPGPPIWPTYVARVRPSTVNVYGYPGWMVQGQMKNPYGSLRVPLVFRILGQKPGWMHVALRTRPNGSTGWIAADDVDVTMHVWSIDVDLTAKVVTVYEQDRVVAQEPVTVGMPATPTPVGEFYVTEIVPGGGGAYGPYAFGLSAHSETLTEFAGGDGQVALHGTNTPGLLGAAASHGCIRIPNSLSAYLGANLPVGTPVRIHP